jgi:heme exporter protein C
MKPIKKALRWSLWLWLSAVIWAAFFWAPPMQGFAGLYGESPQTGRIFFFHVPVAIVSFVAFMVAGFCSAWYLWKRTPGADRAAFAAVESGIVFCVLAIVTGAVWAQVQWGAAWTWDPRQTSILLALLFYGAYLTLRDAIEDPEAKARISAAYGALGIIVAPFLFYVLPHLVPSQLHNDPGSTTMSPKILVVFLASMAGFTALFFWMHRVRRRVLALAAADGDRLVDETTPDMEGLTVE